MYNNQTQNIKSQSNFINNTLLYMGMALLITFITSYVVSKVGILSSFVFGNRAMPIVFFGIELLLVWRMGRNAHRYSKQKLMRMFIMYSIVNGITFSAVFMVYTGTLIFGTFIVASGMFLSSAMIGITTKKDLSIVGRIAMMALMGLILISILSIFAPSLAGNFIINIIGVAVFCALTAYDMQKVKMLHQESLMLASEDAGKMQILAALRLYLDFINLFLYLLRLFSSND